MEANPHLDAIKADPALSSVLDTVGAKLRTLNPTQVEKLVFYLKAAHSYYPKNENHVAYWNEFTDKLESLRNAAEQIELQKRASWQIILGMADSNLKCDTAQPVWCRPNGNSLLARDAG